MTHNQEMAMLNIKTMMIGLPKDLCDELKDAIDNFSYDRSIYIGEHPTTICHQYMMHADLTVQQKVDLLAVMRYVDMYFMDYNAQQVVNTMVV